MKVGTDKYRLERHKRMIDDSTDFIFGLNAAFPT